MSKLTPVTLYRCEIVESSRFSEKSPDCSDCHTRSCQYNTGFSETPCIVTKDAFIDEEGNYVEADGTIINEI